MNEKIIWILIIIVCLTLTGRILLDSKQYDCSTCFIEFKNSNKFTNVTWGHINISVEELFYSWKDNDQCLIRYNPVEGYRRTV